MPQADPNTGVRYFIGSDKPSIPTATKNIVDDIRKLIVPHFTSATLRDLAITGSTTVKPALGPTPGQMCTVNDIVYVFKSGGVGWQQVATVTPWITIPMFTGWTIVSGTIPGPRYRRFAGMIQFDGAAYNAGALVTTGTRLSAPQPSLASAVPSGAGNFLQMAAATQRIADGITMQLLVQEDGSLYAKPSANVSGASINLQGVGFADAGA